MSNHPFVWHPKLAGMGASSSVALIVLWLLSYWVTVPPEVAGAFTALLGFIGGWLAPWLPEPPKKP